MTKLLQISPRLQLSLLVCFVFWVASPCLAQEFGGNPPSVRWRQVEVPAARVIFPAGLDSQAFTVAAIVGTMNGLIRPTIGPKQKQVNIVLQNQTTVANGYVGLAPFRSEFYLTPDLNSFEIGSLPWVEQLSIHEFRHVQQYNNFNVGFSHFLRVLFGEGGQALGNQLSIPNWLFEGDAVFNETLVSAQGRGRLPYFFNGYRALWLADKRYSWMKLRNGSLRDFTPDWYPTGYMLVAYGRQNFGDNFWKQVTHDAAAFRGGIYPLQRAVHAYSGLSYKQFRERALAHFKAQFSGDSSAGQGRLAVHFDADREYPAYIDDRTMLYVRSSYRHIPEFVMRTAGVEHKISDRSASLDNYFAYHDGLIVYPSYRPDLRWTYRDYSELRLLDIKTGRERRITRKTKYFTPDFSPDGKTIAAVDVAANGKSHIHLLDARSGALRLVLPNPSGLFFTYPKFYRNDELVAAVRCSDGTMALAEIRIPGGSVRYLTGRGFQPMAFTSIYRDTVYFTATSGKKDQLYAYDMKSSRLLRLSDTANSGAIGFYQPSAGPESLAWVGFRADGYQVREISRARAHWLQVGTRQPSKKLQDLGISVLENDPASGLLGRIHADSIPVHPYRKLYHLFNFHSVIPQLNDPDYSIAVIGENVLNTFQSQVSLGYNRVEGYKMVGADAIYGAFFPFVRAGVDYLYDRRSFYRDQNVYWNETDPHAGLEVPLDLSAGRTVSALNFGSDIYYSRTDFQAPFSKALHGASYAYLNNFLSISSHVQQARQNIYPRFGSSFSVNYKTAVSGLAARQLLLVAHGILPGLLVNHSLVLNAAHQQSQDRDVISFTNNFPFSRGYVAENMRRMNKAGADYHFPLAYPDAGVANALYVLRMRADLFFDYTRATDNFGMGTATRNFRTAGATLFFDTQWFNEVPVSFGIRYDYLLDADIFGGGGHSRIELVLPVFVF